MHRGTVSGGDTRRHAKHLPLGMFQQRSGYEAETVVHAELVGEIPVTIGNASRQHIPEPGLRHASRCISERAQVADHDIRGKRGKRPFHAGDRQYGQRGGVRRDASSGWETHEGNRGTGLFRMKVSRVFGDVGDTARTDRHDGSVIAGLPPKLSRKPLGGFKVSMKMAMSVVRRRPNVGFADACHRFLEKWLEIVTSAAHRRLVHDD